VTEKSARLLNRFLPAVEMTNHELMQVGTTIWIPAKSPAGMTESGVLQLSLFYSLLTAAIDNQFVFLILSSL